MELGEFRKMKDRLDDVCDMHVFNYEFLDKWCLRKRKMVVVYILKKEIWIIIWKEIVVLEGARKTGKEEFK